MEASLGLCQPQRNNRDMEIKEFSKSGERERGRQRETKQSHLQEKKKKNLWMSAEKNKVSEKFSSHSVALLSSPFKPLSLGVVRIRWAQVERGVK